MANYIRLTAELSISSGKLDEFKKIATEAIERVDANEPNLLSYEWYKNFKAVRTHLENVGALLDPLLELAPLTGLTIYGDPSDELRQALEPFGAKFHKHWHGITR